MSVELAESNVCSGCAACVAVCPRQALTMRPDAEGFLHPAVDEAKCVSCGLCEKACPALHRDEPRQPLKVYAAQSKDDALRTKSSSGGVFSLLAREILSQGGVVYGAAYDAATNAVRHVAAENEGELGAIRGSKYVQSEIGDALSAAKAALKAGRKVLFSGTPCQVAGLRRVIGRDDPNLLAVDVVCHAAPSPLAWRKYVARRLAEIGKTGVPVKSVSFRNKRLGWYQFSVRIELADGTVTSNDILHDSFLRGFLLELYNRPSCHDCRCRELRSGSDLTIADYWMVHETLPDADDDRGTSLVLVNTGKGAAAWEGIAAGLRTWESTYADATRTNPALLRSFKACENRARFFAEVDRTGFDEAAFGLVPKVEFPPDRLVLMGRGKE